MMGIYCPDVMGCPPATPAISLTEKNYFGENDVMAAEVVCSSNRTDLKLE